MAKIVFRHGFKAESDRIALELRSELRLSVDGRLDPARLAAHLEIPVASLRDLSGLAPDHVRFFLTKGKSHLSAVTIYTGKYSRAIVTNPAHKPTRQVNSICHEVSHIVLDHEAETPLSAAGGRDWNPAQEREADWLAACLLIPTEAAHSAAARGLTDGDVAERFGVSPALAKWRMNASGARIRAKRSARFRHGPTRS